MVTDCPKFIPNIFNPSKCSSCFKTREEHGDIALDSKNLRRVIKCGYLFIAPRDWDFCNPSVHRTKRWQRRWFVLYSDDQLTWSIDDHPDTIPQGSLDMREILEVKNAEEVTENAHSLALTGKQTTFIKGINNEDIKAWTASLSKYGNRVITAPGSKRSLTLPGGFGSGVTRFETGVVIGPSRPRFHSVTTTSTATSSTYVSSPEVETGPPSTTSSTSGFSKCFETPSSDVTDFGSPSSVRALRGDPDGCGGLDTSDGGPLRKGWLLKQTSTDWVKHWFVLQNNSLIYYENSEELNPLGRIEISGQTVIKQFESSRHYGFEIIPSGTKNGNSTKLSAITNGMRGIWMKALESAKTTKVHSPEEQSPPPTVATPPSPPLKSKKSRWRKKADLKIFDALKDEFNERERELDALRSGSDMRTEAPRMRELLKSQAVQIDNFRTQLSAGFMEIEKLESFCRARESELMESLKVKDEIVEELRSGLNREIAARDDSVRETKELERQIEVLSEQVVSLKARLAKAEREADLGSLGFKELDNLRQSQGRQLESECELLRQRCNDVTEKLYQSERNAKSWKSKLGRVKSQSLKDRQIESDIMTKVQELESKITRLDGGALSSPTIEGAPLSLPMASSPASDSGSSSGIIGVIMKLNDLDQRVDRVVDSCWFRRNEVEGQSLEYDGPCQNCKVLEMEVQDREEKLELLEGNLKKLEAQFNVKMKELRDFVRETPPSPAPETVSPVTTSPNKYQVEIEQLRSLCSKGLEAMENSHRRMVMELEEKHRREIQSLRIEKENELAEETKATLAALDAMRKNHAAELQRELNKFKDEFVRKFESGQDLNNLHREHEEELHEIKTEILKLSQEYSLKCVEASKLEETVSFLTSQLNEAKRRILDLEGSDFSTFLCSSASKVVPVEKRLTPKPKPRKGLKKEGADVSSDPSSQGRPPAPN